MLLWLSEGVSALWPHNYCLFNSNCLHTTLPLCISPVCIKTWPPTPTVTVHGSTKRKPSSCVSRLDTSDPLLPLRLCFTADRASARVPPLRVIYGQQLLLEPVTRTAGCQMWSPRKHKKIILSKRKESRFFQMIQTIEGRIDLNAAAWLCIDFCWWRKGKCLYYFISQLAARRLLSPCAYWPTVCFIVWGVLYKRSIRGEWLDYGLINALY